MPGLRGTLAQRASIEIGAFYVFTGVVGLIVKWASSTFRT
jgi:hypothetical protein